MKRFLLTLLLKEGASSLRLRSGQALSRFLQNRGGSQRTFKPKSREGIGPRFPPLQRTQGWATPQSWRYRKKPKDGPPVNTKTQTGVLTWNANGTLGQMQITDQINTANGQTCAYSHDDLARITGANCGAVWSQTFNFDPFGNLRKSGSATFQPVYTGATGTGTSPTNQYYSLPDGASGTSNYYDANGNLTNDIA